MIAACIRETVRLGEALFLRWKEVGNVLYTTHRFESWFSFEERSFLFKCNFHGDLKTLFLQATVKPCFTIPHIFAISNISLDSYPLDTPPPPNPLKHPPQILNLPPNLLQLLKRLTLYLAPPQLKLQPCNLLDNGKGVVVVCVHIVSRCLHLPKRLSKILDLVLVGRRHCMPG